MNEEESFPIVSLGANIPIQEPDSKNDPRVVYAGSSTSSF